MIKADYTFVYPLARVGGGDEVSRAVVRRSVEVEAVDPARWQVGEGHVWVVDLHSDIANDDCRQGDGVISPQFSTDRPTGPEPSGRTADPYDRSRELGETEGDEECGSASRT